ASFAARWHDLLGLKSAIHSEHPGTYYSASGRMAKGLPDMAHYVHAPGLEVKPTTGSRILARMKTPPFVRSREHFYGHFHGPDILDAGAALISSHDGRVITFAQPLLAAYLHTGYHAHRTLLRNAFEKLLPERMLRTDAPGQLEITLGKKEGKLILQMLPFIADRRDRNSFESLNEPISIGGFSITLNLGSEISKIHDPITGSEVKFRNATQGLRFRPKPVREHTLLVIE
ncbi:MAG: hypothetical protein ACK49N_03385, partial [Verrucomicrobiota bacterium]